jgi:hypothetical protein
MNTLPQTEYCVKSNLSSLNWITLHIYPIYTNDRLDLVNTKALIQFHKIDKTSRGFKVADTEDYEELWTDSEGFLLLPEDQESRKLYNTEREPRRFDSLQFLNLGLLHYLALDSKTDTIFAGEYWRYYQGLCLYSESLNRPCSFMPGLWFTESGEFKYEIAVSWLRSLQQDLKEKKPNKEKAEEKQKSKKGLVYFIQNTVTRDVKIGMTTSKTAESRLKGLQTGSSAKLVLLKTIKCNIPVDKEKELHAKYAHLRLSGEWFKYENELKTFLDG